MIINSTQFPPQTGKLLRQPNPICLPRLPKASNGASRGPGDPRSAKSVSSALLSAKTAATKCRQTGLLHGVRGRRDSGGSGAPVISGSLLPGPSAHGCTRPVTPSTNSHSFNRQHGAPLGAKSWVSNGDRAGELPPKPKSQSTGRTPRQLAHLSSGGPGWSLRCPRALSLVASPLTHCTPTPTEKPENCTQSHGGRFSEPPPKPHPET